LYLVKDTGFIINEIDMVLPAKVRININPEIFRNTVTDTVTDLVNIKCEDNLLQDAMLPS